MAKLSARGREIVFKVQKTTVNENREVKHTICLMTDFHILYKISSHTMPGSYKDKGKLQNRYRYTAAEYLTFLVNSGYTVLENKTFLIRQMS